MNDDLMQQMQSNPELQSAVDEIAAELSADPDVNLQAIDKLISAFEFTLQNPEAYSDMRSSAIASGVMDPEDIPEQFDPAFLAAALLALKIVKQRMSAPQQAPAGFAKGGLNAIAKAGRRGDTRLAHITPFEDRLLRAHGGSGSINPRTGMPEYGLGSSLKKAFKAIAPIIPLALMFIPGGAAFAGTLGGFLSGGALTGTAAGMLGSAAIGGVSSRLGGGDFLQGAALGAMGSGLGGVIGGAANSTLGLGLGEAGQAVLGSGLVGGVTGAATGQGFAKGAMQGAVGQMVGGQMGQIGGEAFKAGGQQFGGMMAAGYDPKASLTGAVLAGLTTNIGNRIKPSEAATSGTGARFGGGEPSLTAPDMTMQPIPDAGLQTTDFMTGQVGYRGPTDFAENYDLTGGAPVASLGYGGQDMGTSITPPAAAPAPAPSGLNWAKAAAVALPLTSMLGAAKTPEQVKNALSPEQQAYFNKPLQLWDWNRITADATAAGQPLGSYVAYNWNKMDNYLKPVDAPVKKARGGAMMGQQGALSQMAYLAQGGGSGRDDTIDARLSDGEYVMDAETVALVGDGSTKEGAKRFDKMRQQIRSHKGKALAKGKFSPNAKSPLSYIKEYMK
jgi:hypothetical protein